LNISEAFESWKREIQTCIPLLQHFSLIISSPFGVNTQYVMTKLESGSQVLLLNLSLSSKLTDQTFKKVIRSALISSQSLEEAILPMEWLKNVGDEGLIELGKILARNCTNLQKLEINCFGWKELTNKGLEKFAQEICENLGQLEYLGLNFGACGKITGEGIIALGEKIGSTLHGLNELSLELSRTTEDSVDFAEDFMKKFSDGLFPGLKELQFLEMNFSGCPKIGNQGLECLVSGIKEYQKDLKVLMLSFKSCAGITLSTKNKMYKELAHIPAVDIA